MSTIDLEDWRAFKAALDELRELCPDRARYFLTGATGSLRAYAQALRASKLPPTLYATPRPEPAPREE